LATQEGPRARVGFLQERKQQASPHHLDGLGSAPCSPGGVRGRARADKYYIHLYSPSRWQHSLYNNNLTKICNLTNKQPMEHTQHCNGCPITIHLASPGKREVAFEGLRERTEHLDIFFRPSLNAVLFPMFCLLFEWVCSVLKYY